MEVEHGAQGRRTESRAVLRTPESRCDPPLPGSAKRGTGDPPATKRTRVRWHNRNPGRQFLHNADSRHARRGARPVPAPHAMGRFAMGACRSPRAVHSSGGRPGSGSVLAGARSSESGLAPRGNAPALLLDLGSGMSRRLAFVPASRGRCAGPCRRAQLRSGYRRGERLFLGNDRGIRTQPAPARGVVLSQTVLGDRADRAGALSGSRGGRCPRHGHRLLLRRPGPPSHGVQ